jgi:predicted Zn-dependent protease
MVLVVQQRFADAIAVAKRALDLDPLDEPAGYTLALTYFYAGQLEKAVDQLHKPSVQAQPLEMSLLRTDAPVPAYPPASALPKA